jgi:hypothetical protein
MAKREGVRLSSPPSLSGTPGLRRRYGLRHCPGAATNPGMINWPLCPQNHKEPSQGLLHIVSIDGLAAGDVVGVNDTLEHYLLGSVRVD